MRSTAHANYLTMIAAIDRAYGPAEPLAGAWHAAGLRLRSPVPRPAPALPR